MPTIAYDHQIFSLQQFGGISRYFCELAVRVPGIAGMSTQVVAPLYFNAHLASSTAPRIGHHRPVPFRGAGRLYRWFNRTAGPAAMRRLDPQLVHWTYFKPYEAPPGTRTVVTVYDMIHELFAKDFPASDGTSADKRRCVAAASHVICISQSTKDDLMRLFDVPPEKISVTHLGFSHAFSAPDAAPARVSHDARPYLLYVGQRQGYKGFDIALRAYASSKALRDDFDFVAFGGFAFGEPEAALLRGLGLRDGSVRRVAGGDELLAAAYRGAHAFVYPSLYEGFGIPPLEAMGCGCPVVCANTSSLPEVVGSAAETFDPASVDALCEALERVCFDDARRATLIDAGKLRAAMFSWDRCAAETADVYRRLLASDRAAG